MFCIEALAGVADTYGAQEIFNDVQGSTFTANALTQAHSDAGVQISMEGRAW